MPRGLYDTADVPAEALAIAVHFQGEWYNGGLSQFFANWEPEDAAFVPAALRNIGLPQGVGIVAKAIAALGPQSAWRDAGHRAMLDVRSPIAEMLESLDREFFEFQKPFDHAIAEFERRLAEKAGEEMLK